MSNIENVSTESKPFTPEGWAEQKLEMIRQELASLKVWDWQGVREEDATDHLV